MTKLTSSKYKKILLATFCTLLITSCWSSSTTTVDNATTSYSWNWFKMTVPKSWVEVEQNELPAIAHGKIELALTSAELAAWFANNLNIASEPITNESNSVKYAITNYIRTSWVVKEFTKVNETNFNFIDKEEWKIYTFDAKYNLNTPIRSFFQTAKICDSKAYLITIWVSVDDRKTKPTIYENLLKSFECTKS